MSENDWNVSNPINHTLIGSLPEKIRDVKSSTKIILSKEHVQPSTDNAGGQHLKGSLRVYLESSTPATDPEGNDLATTDTSDVGRICVLTGSSNLLKVFVNTSAGISTGWEHLAAGRVYLAETQNANSKPIVNLPAATQSGSPIHAGQLDTGYFKGISTGVLQTKFVSTYIAASGQDGIVVKKARDTVVAGGDQVFNDTLTAVDTWQSLDLSSIVGARTALVHLLVTATNTLWVGIKPSTSFGDSDFAKHCNRVGGQESGCSVGYVSGAGQYLTLSGFTKSDGTILIAGSNTAPTVTMTLIGWI